MSKKSAGISHSIRDLIYFSWIGMIVLILGACSGPVTPEYHHAELEISKSVNLDYLLYIPANYDPEAKWPLLLYLTGNETAEDISLIKHHGPPFALEHGLNPDFFLLAPKLPGDVHWDAEALMTLLAHIQTEYQIDKDKLYVTGIGDRGGWGAWDIAASYPGTFSKIAPISAPACTEICRVEDASIRIYHGGLDSLVPVEDAVNMHFELDYYCKSDVQLVVYDSLGHEIWDKVYGSNEFWLWLTGSPLAIGPPAGKALEGHFSTSLTRTVEDNYLLYLPRKYGKSGKTWPLVVFLHGSGSAIENIEKIRSGGPPKLFEEGMDSDFILLAPQLYANVPWDIDRIHEIIEEIMDDYDVDPQRIYLTGLSRGGFGSWELAVSYPNLFAAVAPIAARDIPGVERLIHSNIWIFHGQDDEGVPWQGSQFMYNRLKKVDANVKLTLYAGVGHNAWDPTYANDEFWQWLLKQKKPGSDLKK